MGIQSFLKKVFITPPTQKQAEALRKLNIDPLKSSKKQAHISIQKALDDEKLNKKAIELSHESVNTDLLAMDVKLKTTALSETNKLFHSIKHTSSIEKRKQKLKDIRIILEQAQQQDRQKEEERERTR